MNADIRTIPHADQRYPTAGDWWWEGDTLHIRVSQLGDPRFEFLVAVHEFVEAMLCKFQGVPEHAVDRWDLTYKGDYADDPGNDPGAPYHNQHREGIVHERLLAYTLALPWPAYEASFDALPSHPSETATNKDS